MVNFNGSLFPDGAQFLNHQNRGLRYGDALFETMRAVMGKIVFWEDHYLRLMASMRILRMEIPMQFTMEFLEAEILGTIQARGNHPDGGAYRIRFSVFRDDGGLYLPLRNDIQYLIEAVPLEVPFFMLGNEAYEVELFKDFYVHSDMLSTLKTNNRIINVLGSIYARENGYDNGLLLNQDKRVVEALNGNLFMTMGHTIITPPLKDGCLNGIIRKKLIEIIGKLEDYEIKEESISPFDLQKADELFLTNSIMGIRPITQYRKKTFGHKVAADLIGKLNAVARLQGP